MTDSKALQEEQRKIRQLKIIVDLTTAILHQATLSLPEALRLVKATKKSVLNLFPDKEDTYNLIFKPRFERIIKEKLEKN